ncbi:hypothetical protein TanjilG_18418 [Lupinus angustifolius]|uniref:Uncharacterized protein n=1 Tax=Lupinus angustifolius TaxID=3871 RepID=A0A4P1RXG3_LUPAN|nr:hypothetical protein TanjilG_18418 [Lupinus angustifolius]
MGLVRRSGDEHRRLRASGRMGLHGGGRKCDGGLRWSGFLPMGGDDVNESKESEDKMVRWFAVVLIWAPILTVVTEVRWFRAASQCR